MFCYLIILFAATTVTFAGPIVEASNALADLENSIDMSQSNVVKRSDLDSSGVDVDQGSGDTPQSSTSPNFLQDDRNIANPIIDPIDSIESSSFPQNDLVLANSMSASSLSSACTSDASAKELLEDTTVQKRAFKICPSDFKQTGQHHSGTQEVVPLLLPKPTRETHENPCRHTRKPFWVMCGGPMIGYAVGYADYVLNCVPGQLPTPLPQPQPPTQQNLSHRILRLHLHAPLL